MNGNRQTIVKGIASLYLLASVSAFGASAENTQVKGMIITRTGETLIVSNPQGRVTVVLTEDTITKDDRGLFGLEKEHLGSTVLIPGLKIKVKGVSDDQGRIVAKEITVDGDDLETAAMIQAGLHPTAEQVSANMQAIEANRTNIAANQQNVATNQQNIAANQQNIVANKQQIEQNIKNIEEQTNRFTALSEYDIKDATTVRFDVGSSKISEKDMEQLRQVAHTAASLRGYIVEVVGYTDSTGGAAINDRLSEDRAKAVIRYLVQQGKVPIRHIVAPGAMGEYGEVASNESAAGRAENRRVEVKVLVNKGIAGN